MWLRPSGWSDLNEESDTSKVLWCWNRICSSGKKILTKIWHPRLRSKNSTQWTVWSLWSLELGSFIEWRDYEKYNGHLGPNKERFKLTEKDWTFRVEPGRNCYDQKWHCRQYNNYQLPEVIWSAEGKCKKDNGGNQRTPVANKPLYMQHHCITYYSHSLAPQENQFLSISRLGCGKELTWMLLNVKITLRTAANNCIAWFANNCIAWFGVGVWDLRSENVMLQACHQWLYFVLSIFQILFAGNYG